MSLRVEAFEIEGPLLIHGVRHHDDRGFFSEIYKESAFYELGLPRFVQDNLSKSKKGVFRGLHWQSPPMQQGKLVSCLQGEILDYIVDVRRSSPTFGASLSVPLSGNQVQFFWVPPGFAHGFESMADETLVSYKVTQYWSQLHEQSLNPLDPELGLRFNNEDIVLSLKDRDAPSFLSQTAFFD
jgi:dTDP-4-dehydrorhamnose 3,5-epimerase